MAAVKSPNPKNASSYLGYQILLSSEKDALKSPNLMAASSRYWTGCCEHLNNLRISVSYLVTNFAK